MHDGAFPAVPRPNPFIPVPLQKSLKMPHADASREMEFASSIAARLFSSAQNLVASFPRTSEGAERSPSPFVTAFSGSPPQLSPSQDPLQHLLNSSPAYDKTSDHRAPVIASSKPVSGGTGLIKDQALCPFRAFVRHRLRCEALVSLDIGLDPMQRGNLVHSTLEFFWKDVREQVKLCGMNPDTREKKMRSASRGAISRFERENRHDLFMDVRVIEEERLVRLGLEWLEVELARAPFVVEEYEADRECTLGRLTIKTKVDRVDRLESGGIAVIDYKTGKPDPLQWLSDRLSEPQLPIYVQEFKEDNIAAVLFAQIRKGECRFRGLASCEDEIPKVPGRKMVEKLSELELDFSAVLERWGKALPQIADDFVSGNALVDPLDGEKTCRYCDYPALCRVTEQKDLKSEGVDG
jgi:probable DNA repair protein